MSGNQRPAARHISEMTVADQERYERDHHILPDWGTIWNRRRRQTEIDAAALAARAARERAESEK